ncbi:MAG: DUF697 domain-containing protein [Planctomycetales bacterium]
MTSTGPETWNQWWESWGHSRETPGVWETMRSKLPAPVFWLLGKTQSGKTSLIRALTGEERVEIGNGFQPCTKTAQMYAFPPEGEPILRFLDTRGLGEASYDPGEDLELFQNQAHLLIVVMKALDHAQHSILEAVKRIHSRRPDWPILVVQTSLHEGYPTREMQHILPYPFANGAIPDTVPDGLARSLRSQREVLEKAGIAARYVPVDFTLPEDGYIPEHYGLDSLWDEIESLLPLGLRAMLAEDEQLHGQLRDASFHRAHKAILSYSVAAGATALMPVPAVDLPAVVGIQAKMCHTVAGIYHQELSMQGIAELFGALGMGFMVRLGGRELLKFIPGIGSSVAALYAAATTYALGLTLCAYFSRIKRGAIPQPEEFRKIYDEYYATGRERLRVYLEQTRKPSPPAS